MYLKGTKSMPRQNSPAKRVLCLSLLAALAHFAVPNNQAQEKGSVTLSDAKELEAFLDPIFAEQMAKLHIPGAAIAVVKDGQLFFAKGYGYADLEKKTPVIADKTPFCRGGARLLLAHFGSSEAFCTSDGKAVSSDVQLGVGVGLGSAAERS
jgi:beta-lactamase family protein